MSEKENKPEVRPGMRSAFIDRAVGAILVWSIILIAFMICSLVHSDPRVLGERGGGVEVDDGR